MAGEQAGKPREGRYPEEAGDTMSIDSLRGIVADLAASAGALAVLGTELHSRASGKPIHPELRPYVQAILEEIGATAAMDGISREEFKALFTEIRHFWLLDSEVLSTPERAPGWTHTDGDILETGGELTEGFANVLARIAPQFEDLAARLENPNGSFLDVGTGIARLSIAIAHHWPSLRIVAIDTWEPSLSLARTNIAAAGLQDRIELRRQDAAELPDERAFDLVWIPAPFIAPEKLWRIVARAHRALKPGGWLLFATAKPGTDLRASLMAFRVASWGGQLIPQDQIEKRLAEAEFAQIRVLPGPPRDFKMIIAARRAPGAP
jgi:SAM-dependent methyltransferase